MITAKNYAAQAERSLRIIAEVNAGHEMTSTTALCLAETIKAAQHFAIPDNGRLFDDDLKGLDLSNIRLPFEYITVEWFVSKPLGDGKQPVPKRILVASEYDDMGLIVCCGVYGLPGAGSKWGFNPFQIIIKMDENVPFANKFAGGSIFPFHLQDGRVMEVMSAFTQDQFADALHDGRISSKEARDALQDSTQELMGLFEFLEALSCKNVISEPIEKINHEKNTRRIRDGKLPIYETRILTIDTGYNSGGKHNIGICSSDRASVRQHLRRGHIRRHPTAGNIWVNSCVVGDADIGVINKQYIIK